MCKRCTDFFIHSASKTLLFYRAISELGENWGSLGGKKASRMGAERRRRAGNGAPLFFFIPQFFPQLGTIKQALRGLRCIFIAAAQRMEAVSYVPEENDAACVSFATEAGFIFEVSGAPKSDENFAALLSMVMASIQGE